MRLKGNIWHLILVTWILIVSLPYKKVLAEPEFLYKIISIEDWRKTELTRQVVKTNVDKDFIHLATEDQICSIVQKFWKDQNYVILKFNIDELKKLKDLRYETNPGGTTYYYHLYGGSIPFEAIQEAKEVDQQRIIYKH
jgi:uncharacterized protein (DUF952 family)